MELRPTHALYFYDTEDSRYDLECAINGKNMRLMLDDLRNNIRSKIKYEDHRQYEEFRDMLNALIEEYDLQNIL